MRLSKKLIAAATVSCILSVSVYASPAVKKNVKSKPGNVLSVKISKNYNQIDKLIEDEKFYQADSLLNNMLKSNPNDITARALYIISAAKQDKLDVAQEQLNKYLPKYYSNANLHYAQGIVYLKRQASSDMEYRNNSEQLIKEAINEFNTALKYDPRHFPSYNALGVISINTGNMQKAREYFGKALNIDKNYSTAVDNLGTVDYLDGDYDLAQQRFLKAISMNQNSSTAYFHLAQVYDKQSLYSKSLDAVDHSLRLKPKSSVAHNLKGEILKKQGNEAAAIEAFKKSISVKPENTKPYINLAKIYEKRFDNEFAIANLKTALSVNPSLNQVKLYIADLSLLKGDNKEALKYYSSLVGVEGYNTDALTGIANAYFADAKASVSQNALGRNKDLENAYDNVKKALVVSPNNLQLYLAKLKLAKMTNREKDTQETLDKIIASPVRGFNDLLAKGDAYLAMNKYQEAKESFENAVAFAQSTDDYLFISEILTYDKFYPSAKAILRKVLVNEPNNEEALHNLNYIMTMEKQSESLYKDAKFLNKKDKNKVFAREYALKSLDMNPTNYNAALLSAKLCEKQKHYKEAADSYKIVAGLEQKPRKIKKYSKKAKKLEKKYNKINTRYMKKEDKEFKKWQNSLTPSL
ncbi:tetratricopeptide repeat protein [bacterium]|nr:tetratricopeptide repeat protein [bacterium]